MEVTRMELPRMEMTRIEMTRIFLFWSLYKDFRSSRTSFNGLLQLRIDVFFCCGQKFRIRVLKMAFQLDFSEEEYSKCVRVENDGPSLVNEDPVVSIYVSRHCLDKSGLYSCLYCGMETENVDQFKAHLVLFHEVTLNSVSCWDCKKSFRSVKTLLLHVFHMHMAEILFQIHGVDLEDMEHVREFNRMSLLVKFDLFVATRKAQFLPRQPQFECWHCRRNFKNFNQMEEHMRRKNKRFAPGDHQVCSLLCKYMHIQIPFYKRIVFNKEKKYNYIPSCNLVCKTEKF